MQSADLTRYAGQFVWLELNFDKAENQAFLTKYGAVSTPTFYIIDPKDGHVAATQAGAMSLSELQQFLSRGAHNVFSKTQHTADADLTRGDANIAKHPKEAVTAYREALHLAPANWPRRELAEASLTTALQAAREYQLCAKTAASEAAE